MRAHETAIIDKTAEIDDTVEIGPYAVIEENTIIRGGTKIHTHAVVKKGTRIGRDCAIHCGAVLGDTPQDTKFKGEETYLIIGNGNVIREYATLHRASGEGNVTVIGDNNMLMAQSHVAHNCVVGNNVVLANLATLGGHVEVEDRVFFGGMAGAHQFVRIGELAMIGGGSVLFEDVPPYMTVAGGYRPWVCGLNTVGLLRAAIDGGSRNELKKAYRILYKSEGCMLAELIIRLGDELEMSPEVVHLIDFLKQTKRGVSRGKAGDLSQCDSE